MRLPDFYEARRADWEALEGLLRRGPNLAANEIAALGQLYRAAAADLALAQRDFPQQEVALYLNQLVARAHAAIYRRRGVTWAQARDFLRTGWPRLFREHGGFILAAFFCFALPAVSVGNAAYLWPEAMSAWLPASARALVPQIQNGQLWTNIPISARPYASAFIMQNNIQVMFLAFGGGVLLGLGTLWILFFNGLLLGSLLGLTGHYGLGFDLATFVIGHGVIELSVIWVVGGVGLRMGWAIARPGLLRRRDALAQVTQRGARLIVACLPLLVMAGLMEGFLSPNENIPWWVKWGAGLITGAALYGYWLLAGK